MTCYPFGLTIKCSCDTRGRPLQCLPVIDFGLLEFLLYESFYQVLDYSVGLNVGGGAGAHTGINHGEGEKFNYDTKSIFLALLLLSRLE